ncbi:MAG TPA: flagellar hook assembly protein FlgD [Herbaspirillum sp.]
MTVSNDLLASMNGTSNTSNKNGSNGLTSNSAADTQARFLTLLTTQLQNQDPTNPMDNSQLTTQIAQLSTVSGIEQLNSSVANLMASLQSGQTVQATGMIGHSVLAPGNNIQLASTDVKNDDGTTTTKHSGVFGAQLASKADDVKVTIRDGDGNVVDSIDLGAQDAGTLPIIWDGTKTDGTIAPDGNYTFEIAATAGGQAVTSTNLAFGTVTSVTNGAAGAKLNVSNIGSINVSDVVQIL